MEQAKKEKDLNGLDSSDNMSELDSKAKSRIVSELYDLKEARNELGGFVDQVRRPDAHFSHSGNVNPLAISEGDGQITNIVEAGKRIFNGAARLFGLEDKTTQIEEAQLEKIDKAIETIESKVKEKYGENALVDVNAALAERQASEISGGISAEMEALALAKANKIIGKSEITELEKEQLSEKLAELESTEKSLGGFIDQVRRPDAHFSHSGNANPLAILEGDGQITNVVEAGKRIFNGAARLFGLERKDTEIEEARRESLNDAITAAEKGIEAKFGKDILLEVRARKAEKLAEKSVDGLSREDEEKALGSANKILGKEPLTEKTKERLAAGLSEMELTEKSLDGFIDQVKRPDAHFSHSGNANPLAISEGDGQITNIVEAGKRVFNSATRLFGIERKGAEIEEAQRDKLVQARSVAEQKIEEKYGKAALLEIKARQAEKTAEKISEGLSRQDQEKVLGKASKLIGKKEISMDDKERLAKTIYNLSSAKEAITQDIGDMKEVSGSGIFKSLDGLLGNPTFKESESYVKGEQGKIASLENAKDLTEKRIEDKFGKDVLLEVQAKVKEMELEKDLGEISHDGVSKILGRSENLISKLEKSISSDLKKAAKEIDVEISGPEKRDLKQKRNQRSIEM